VIASLNIVLNQEVINKILQNGIDIIGATGDVNLVDGDGSLLTDIMKGKLSKTGSLKETVDTKGIEVF